MLFLPAPPTVISPCLSHPYHARPSSNAWTKFLPSSSAGSLPPYCVYCIHSTPTSSTFRIFLEFMSSSTVYLNPAQFQDHFFFPLDDFLSLKYILHTPTSPWQSRRNVGRKELDGVQVQGWCECHQGHERPARAGAWVRGGDWVRVQRSSLVGWAQVRYWGVAGCMGGRWRWAKWTRTSMRMNGFSTWTSMEAEQKLSGFDMCKNYLVCLIKVPITRHSPQRA